MTTEEALGEITSLTPAKLRECGIIAEGRAAAIIAELHSEPAYEQGARLTMAAELLRARDVFLRRAVHIDNFGPTDQEWADELA